MNLTIQFSPAFSLFKKVIPNFASSISVANLVQ